MIRQTLVVLSKDLLLEWRGRGRIMAVLVFGITALLLFSFAATSTQLKENAPGYLWLALLLCSTLSLAGSFTAEVQNRAQEGLLLLPTDPRAIYYGKAIANLIVLLVLGVVLVPGMVILYNVSLTMNPLWLLLTLALGAAGLAGPGTLHASLISRVRGGEVLLPLLLFPLIVPVLVSAAMATRLVLTGDPMGQLSSWLTLLACFDLIFWSLCGLLSGRLLEEA